MVLKCKPQNPASEPYVLGFDAEPKIFKRFYLFVHEGRGAEAQAEGEAGSMQGA